MVTCTGNRIAQITSETGTIDGDTDHEATDGQDKPTDWVDNILSMKFYKDNTYRQSYQTNFLFFKPIFRKNTPFFVLFFLHKFFPQNLV